MAIVRNPDWVNPNPSAAVEMASWVPAARLVFLSKCEDLECQTVAEFYQRCLAHERPESAASMAMR